MHGQREKTCPWDALYKLATAYRLRRTLHQDILTFDTRLEEVVVGFGRSMASGRQQRQ